MLFFYFNKNENLIKEMKISTIVFHSSDWSYVVVDLDSRPAFTIDKGKTWNTPHWITPHLASFSNSIVMVFYG